MATVAVPLERRPLDPVLGARLRFWSLVAMVLLVYVHAYPLHPRYLQPATLVDEPASPATVVQYLFANGLLRFRIPLLFAISGYLFAWRDEGGAAHRTRLVRRLRTLGVPYLAWSALALLGTWALEQWAPTRTLVAASGLTWYGPGRELVSSYALRDWLTRWTLDPLAFQLWFLRSLLLLNLAYPWIAQAVDRAPRALGGVLAVLWLLGVPIPAFGEAGLLFFGLGVWLARRDHPVDRLPWAVPLPLVAALWLGASAVRTALAFTLETTPGGVALAMLLLHRVGELCGLGLAWVGGAAFADRAMRHPVVARLTGASFLIYVLHVPLVHYVVEAILAARGSTPAATLTAWLVAPLVVIALAVAVSAGLRRAAPGLYGWLTGGRGLPASVSGVASTRTWAASVSPPPPT
jgi:fucose 4-O-acetylase-like acetyltransferase